MIRSSQYTDARSAQRYQALLAAQNVTGETFPRPAESNATAMVTQSVYYVSIGLLAGDVVTNLLTHVSTGGTSITLVKVGIYSKALALLASSGDVSTQYTTVAAKTNALSSPYTVLTTDGYLLAVMAVFTGTAPQLLRGIGGVGTNADTRFTGGTLGTHAVQTLQADLPNPAVPVWAGGSPLATWMGWN